MRRVVIGAAVVTGAYLLYRFKNLPKQIVNVNGVPTTQYLGSAFNLGDPYLYAAIAAGAIAGRFIG